MIKKISLTTQQIELLTKENNEYYCLQVQLVELATVSRVYAYIIRRDTGEFLKEFYKKDVTSHKQGFELALNFLRKKLAYLTAPRDWEEPDKERLIINKEIMYQQEWLKLMNKVRINKETLSPEEVISFAQKAAFLSHQYAIDTCRTLNSFTENELFHLIGCPPEESEYILESEEDWDRTEAKYNLYRYILSPSFDVKKAHDDFTEKYMERD